MYDVVALGETLIDFTPEGTNTAGMQLFARNPGGAPANVLAMNAKLGGRTAFIGKVGHDDFGSFLRKTMESAGINCSGLIETDEAPTTLAFVQLNERGDRSFTFVRKPGADVLLKWTEVNTSLLKNCKIFHFGSVSMTDEPSRTATYNAANYAKEHGALISYDPNYRHLLWSSETLAIEEMKKPLKLSDILKVSEEEMRLLTREDTIEAGAEKLISEGISLAIVTLGPEGSYYKAKSSSGYFDAVDVNTIDTTGAGDAFVGSLHYCLAGKDLEQINSMNQDQWTKIMTFCNVAASLTTAGQGAIPAMPSLDLIKNYIEKLGSDNATFII